MNIEKWFSYDGDRNQVWKPNTALGSAFGDVAGDISKVVSSLSEGVNRNLQTVADAESGATTVKSVALMVGAVAVLYYVTRR